MLAQDLLYSCKSLGIKVVWEFPVITANNPWGKFLCTNEQSDVTFFASSVSIQILERVVLVGLTPQEDGHNH